MCYVRHMFFPPSIHNLCVYILYNGLFSIQTGFTGKTYIHPKNVCIKLFLVTFIQLQIFSHLVWVNISRSMMAAVVMLPVIGSILNRPLMPDDWME